MVHRRRFLLILSGQREIIKIQFFSYAEDATKNKTHFLYNEKRKKSFKFLSNRCDHGGLRKTTVFPVLFLHLKSN